MHSDGAKSQVCIFQKICTKVSQTLLSLPSTREKNFSFHFKRNNLTIHVVSFYKTYCTCSLSSIRQDPTVESGKKFKNSFGLLELEIAVLGCFLRKKGHVPLGITKFTPTKMTMSLEMLLRTTLGIL
jgi:hypothetical protein